MIRHPSIRAWVHRILVVLAATALFESTLAQSPNPLLDALIRKGILTEQEAAEIAAELDAATEAKSAETTALKQPQFKTARWVERIELFGDARFRYEYRGGENVAGEDLERQRWRYRLRFGARMQLAESLLAGLRLETGPGGRSSNVTFGDENEPWGKNSDRLHVGLLYLDWAPVPWLSATVGRQEIPFETTSMVWDGDLTPEGLSQRFRHQNGRWELFATLGQFLYDDANPDNPLGAARVTDAYLLSQQAGIRFQANQDVSAQLAPTIHVYTGGGDSFNSTFVGTSPANSHGINDLLVLEIPVEVRFRAGPLPLRWFGHFAVNLHGRERAAQAGFGEEDHEIYAYQTGLEIGSARRRGGWMIRGFWQRTGLFALDPNLVDSDLFDSRLNLQGFSVQGAYGITDFLTFTVTYAQADQANRALPTLGAGDLIAVNPLRYYQLLQADLNLRF